MNYWPIINTKKIESLTGYVLEKALSNDYSGNSNIYPIQTMFTNDRFGKVNSALSPNGFNLTIQSGVYFSNESFTFSLWIKFKKFDSNAKIIDVFNLKNDSSKLLIDSIQIWQSEEGIPLIKIQQINGESRITKANSGFKLNSWQFFAVSLNHTYLKMFLNGSIISEDNEQFIPVNAWRKYAYIGLNSDSVFDEIRIYNRALGIDEIANLMNTGYEITPQNTVSFPKKTSHLLKKRSVIFSQSSNGYGYLIHLILIEFHSTFKKILRFFFQIFL
jgi:hypothetical protein